MSKRALSGLFPALLLCAACAAGGCAQTVKSGAGRVVMDYASHNHLKVTEQKVQTALERLMQQRTTLVIAHRLSTVQQLSRVLVLDGGEIAEEGTPDELLQKDIGIFKDMYELQLFKTNGKE